LRLERFIFYQAKVTIKEHIAYILFLPVFDLAMVANNLVVLTAYFARSDLQRVADT